MERNPSSSVAPFEGITGRVAAVVMAGMNRDMEVAAVEALGPRATPDALSIGCGPGEGMAALTGRFPEARTVGIDPSAAMVRAARRRNREAIRRGHAEVVRASADAVPEPDGAFGAATAVNSLQLWDPLDPSVAELARVLRPGGVFVAMTHEWAVRRHGSVDHWLDHIGDVLARHGFGDVANERRRFRSGDGLVVRAVRGDGRELHRGDRR